MCIKYLGKHLAQVYIFMYTSEHVCACTHMNAYILAYEVNVFLTYGEDN